MSEQQQKDTKNKQKQTKPGNQAQKKNTDAWKQKQAAKKKQKEAQGQAGETKEDKKQKKKKQKQQQKAKQQQKGQSNNGGKQKPKVEPGSSKKQSQKQSKKQSQKQQNGPKIQAKKYKKLQTIQTLIMPKHIQLGQNRQSLIQLIQKQIHNLISSRDTILYLGTQKLHNSPKLSSGCGKNNYQIVQIPGYTHQPNSQIVCRYEDISYVISQKIDKIFLQANVIFKNGSVLVAKGYENIGILTNYYNKQLIISCGSWNYCHRNISSYSQLQSIYGQDIINKYDWISNNYINLICMEFGSVLPCQISYYIDQGYRNFGLTNVQW